MFVTDWAYFKPGDNMKAFCLALLVYVSSWALDMGDYDHSGVYDVMSAQACASFGFNVKCAPGTERDTKGNQIVLVQSGDKNSLLVCVGRNFRNKIFNASTFCYKKSTDENMVLMASGSGFQGHRNERESQTYSRFRRTGAGYQLTEGISSRGVDFFYVYTLSKQQN